MAWSFASLVFQDFPLMYAISSPAIAACTEFHHQSISNMAWAVARICLIDLPLMYALASSAMQKISDFECQDISNTLWAFSSPGLARQLLLSMVYAWK